VYADRAYDSEPHRQRLRAPGIDPQIARRRTPHGSGLGRYRWVVERAFSWFHRPRKLRLRTEWRDDIREALMAICCSLIRGSVLTSSLS
jgi:transposase